MDYDNMKIQTEYFNLIPYENLLHIETFMAWDDRVATEYIEGMRSIAFKFYHDKPWAMLVDRRGWGLHTPEAEKLLSENAVGKFKTPLSHIAVIAGKSEIKKWQIDKTVENVIQFETRLFDNVQEAKDWLVSLGYHMTPLEDEEQ